MTRSLKTFLKAKRWICSKRCECLTINARRCADLQEGNEFCGCGESKLSLPNYVRVEDGRIHFFNENEDQNNDITVEMDTELGIWELVVGEFLAIENEEARALWVWTWENLDGEAGRTLFGMDEGREWTWHFTPEAMAQFNALINNPTEAQAQILTNWLENKASNEQLIVVFDE